MRHISQRLTSACLCTAIAAALLAVSGRPAMGQMLMGARAAIFAPGGAPLDPSKSIKGLHIERANQIMFNPYTLTDGGGFRWDFQYSAYLNSGSSAFSGGMYMQFTNSGFNGTSQGFINKAGDEIETSPMMVYNRQGLSYTRRVKVYKDASLSRWLEIFENTNAAESVLNVTIRTNTNRQITGVATSANGKALKPDDWGVALDMPNAGPQMALPMFMFCDRRAKVRPQVQVDNRSQCVNITYTLTVPGNGTVVLCNFLSQGASMQDNVKTMASFRAAKYLRDLPPEVRKLLTGFSSASSGIAQVELDRSESSDAILLKRGDPILGKITNDSFTMQTLVGERTFKADQLIGMSCEADDGSAMVLLADGQALSGVAPQQKIDITLSTGGKLSVPLESIRQWSYRITDKKPADLPFTSPMVILRSGDCLYVDAKKLKLEFRTRNGKLDLSDSRLMEILLDNSNNGVHRATFAGGTVIGGIVEPGDLSLPVLMADKPLEVSRDMVYRFALTPDEKPDPFQAILSMNNDDELHGQLADKSIKITTEFGDSDIDGANIRELTFSQPHDDRVVATLWDGSVLRGVMGRQELTFKIAGGPTVTVPTSQVVRLVSDQAKPPAEIAQAVARLIPQLGAGTYEKREEATKLLLKLGPGILPVLREQTNQADPEIKRRLETIIEKLNALDAKDRPGDPGGNAAPGVRLPVGKLLGG